MNNRRAAVAASDARPVTAGARVLRLPATLAVFVSASVLRLAYVLSLDYAPYSDMAGYDAWAWNLARGDGIPGGAYWDQYPLYLAFLAGCYRLFGHTWEMVRIGQALIGAGTAALTALLAARLLPGRRATPLLAGAIVAVFPDLVLHAGAILTETLYGFLLVAALIVWQKSIDEGEWRLRVVAGGLLGLLILTRSAVVFFLPFALAWELLRTWPGLLPGARRCLVVGLTMLVVWSPWLLRNARTYGTPLPPTAQMGLGLWGGNNDRADGYWVAEPWSAEQRASLDAMQPVERHRYAAERGVEWIRDNPVAFAGLAVQKLSRMLSLKPDAVFRGNFFGKWVELGVPVSARAALYFLAVIGAVYTWRERRRLALIYALLVGHVVMTVLLFAYARYTAPLVPALAVLAAAGVVTVARLPAAARARVRPDRRAVVAFGLALLLIVNWGIDTARNMETLETFRRVDSLTDCDPERPLAECEPEEAPR